VKLNESGRKAQNAFSLHVSLRRIGTREGSAVKAKAYSKSNRFYQGAPSKMIIEGEVKMNM